MGRMHTSRWATHSTRCISKLHSMEDTMAIPSKQLSMEATRSRARGPRCAQASSHRCNQATPSQPNRVAMLQGTPWHLQVLWGTSMADTRLMAHKPTPCQRPPLQVQANLLVETPRVHSKTFSS